VADKLEAEVSELVQRRRRRRRLARAVSVVVVIVVAAAFVVENSQPVKVRLWFVTGHPRLIWVVLVCLIAGLVFGYLVGRERQRRRSRRRGLLRRARRDRDDT
jgi:uncharacterized integral membrane protein